jgi:LacI family transcriptional regulator
MHKVTINDIASRTGLSKGAVSKALGGKKGVSESTRKMVLQAAKSMGYQVNTAAQALARSTMKLGIVMPSVWEEYYGELKRGIDRRLGQISRFNVAGEYRYYESLYSSDGIRAALDELAQAKVDGIILCPGSVTKIEGYSEYYHNKHIPFVLLATDSHVREKVANVRIDSQMAGTIAGELISLIVQPEKTVIVFIGNKDIEDHKQKVSGFCAAIAGSRFSPPIVFETQDEPELASVLARKKLVEIPDVGGIYIATENSAAICRAITELGLQSDIRVVATDVFPDIKEYMDSGLISGVIYQNPIRQGELAVACLYQCISERIPASVSPVVPTLLLKSGFNRMIGETKK